MSDFPLLTYIGGPTVLIEWRGLRMLTDPTFDPGGTSYPTAIYTLRKTIGPAIPPEQIGPLDLVLLSHDHHFDNLDHAGRRLLSTAARVITTVAGAARLESNARGLSPGETILLDAPHGGRLQLTATPARHGPADGDRGPVIGFLLRWLDTLEDALYVSGDTVWYEAVDQVRNHGPVRAVLAFAGAARVQAAGDHPLTLTAEDAVRIARAFEQALVVPVHYEGWEHFSQGRSEVESAFADAGLSSRLLWLEPGKPTPLPR